jgi:hypothetical protein
MLKGWDDTFPGSAAQTTEHGFSTPGKSVRLERTAKSWAHSPSDAVSTTVPDSNLPVGKDPILM